MVLLSLNKHNILAIKKGTNKHSYVLFYSDNTVHAIVHKISIINNEKCTDSVHLYSYYIRHSHFILYKKRIVSEQICSEK
jgi:hypothetical protein